VATNTAGRGTDILLSREVRESGGLHVVMGCYPENDRIEAQGLGRAARQGQPGSGVLVVNAGDLPDEAKGVGSLNAASLEAYRRDLQTGASAKRVAMACVAHSHHQKMTDFFAKLAIWRAHIDEDFLQKMNEYLLNVGPSHAWRPSNDQNGAMELSHLLRLVSAEGGSSSHFRDWLEQFKGRLDSDLISAWGRCFEAMKDEAEAHGAFDCPLLLSLHSIACDVIYARHCTKFIDYSNQPLRAFENALDVVLATIRV
jgi:hypothetical protein